ncbi:hypothetical protein SKAU_G00348840 [Synaphobranchus kaupii]|uniref:Uncharacterized protein n=1 Tax=Synaphobranchus kaupii TaxID=118154 RepID=A0A9Q1EK28_SYNKA|nr:hypothetical protein SKAU_G00348840 [Synaphobranchus kaupii]
MALARAQSALIGDRNARDEGEGEVTRRREIARRSAPSACWETGGWVSGPRSPAQAVDVSGSEESDTRGPGVTHLSVGLSHT